MALRLRSILSLFYVLCLLALSFAQHGEEGGEEGGAENEAKSEPLPPCARPLEELHHSIEELFGDNYTVYINCLSFDAKGALRTGIASGENPGEPDMRFVIECLGEILVAQSEVIPNTPIDRTDIRDTSCLECNTSATTNGSCTEMCNGECERCYESANRCTRCTACTSEEAKDCKYEEGRTLACATTCPVSGFTPNHELYNHCECAQPNFLFLNAYPPPPAEPEIECEHVEPFAGRCVSDCRAENPAFDPNNETGICWACGLPYCIVCNRAINQCVTCIRDTVLYEHECHACPEAPIALAAIEQEHEIEEEEEEKRLRTIELAVSLPIASVLIIVFFVGMSVFAHSRYPHVSYHGHKRHRKPPTVERSMSPTATNDDDDQQQSSHVWRPRPTIVLR